MDRLTGTTSLLPLMLNDEQAAGRPLTIPALKAWTAHPTPYHFGAQTRIVLDARMTAQLYATASVFADDLLALTELRPAITIDGTLQPGDIFLTLEPGDPASQPEGYMLEVTPLLTIRAQTATGIFYGTRTVLQLLKQSFVIPGGTACDWPAYPERSLMVDMGRKYFSIHWLEQHIRELAYLKYNYFHFHLSDNYGFRLESERHPEIVSPEHYSKAEIRSLIELASKYHITIVPEIDMPSHMDTILAAHPELQLTGLGGKRRGGDIDLAKDESYQLMREILEEYIPLFPGPFWHIGADEYIMQDDYERYPQLLAFAREHYGPDAVIKDTYLGFVNWANEIVKAHGKITRAWNDGLHGGSAIKLADDIIYEHWYRSGLEPQAIVDLNLHIINSNADYLYYVLGNDNWRAKPDAIYESFEHHIFHGPLTIEASHPRHLGAKLHVWCDNPVLETEEEIAQGIAAPLRSLAQKSWGSLPLVAGYTNFAEIIARIGHAPGLLNTQTHITQQAEALLDEAVS